MTSPRYDVSASMSKMKRAALYARVSTGEDRQDPGTQLRLLREYAGRRGFDVAGE